MGAQWLSGRVLSLYIFYCHKLQQWSWVTSSCNISYDPPPTYTDQSKHVVECLTQNRGPAGSSLSGITALGSLSRHFYPSLELAQPRKTRPCLTEILLMGSKKKINSNKQTTFKSIFSVAQLVSNTALIFLGERNQCEFESRSGIFFYF